MKDLFFTRYIIILEEHIIDDGSIHFTTDAVENEIQRMVEIGYCVEDLSGEILFLLEPAERVAENERSNESEEEEVQREQELVDLAVLLRSPLGYIALS